MTSDGPKNITTTKAAEDGQGSGPGIRVILADSQAIYRVGMRKVFALEDDIRVVAQAETLENLYASLQRFPTDVVLLEGQLIAGTVDAIPQFVRRAPNAKLIVQVSESDESNTVELYRRGVRGVVPRSISPDLLVKCVRKIAEGETWIDNKSINWVIEAYRAQATTLTDPKVQPKLSKKELYEEDERKREAGTLADLKTERASVAAKAGRPRQRPRQSATSQSLSAPTPTVSGRSGG